MIQKKPNMYVFYPIEILKEAIKYLNKHKKK